MSTRFVAAWVYGTVVLLALAWTVPAALLIPLPSPGEDYNTAGFLIRHSWVKFARVATDPWRADLSAAEEDARVRRFFELNEVIGEQEQVAGDPQSAAADAASARISLAALREERAGMENDVEEILEGRLTELLEDLGLTRHFGGDIVWPPVNVEFEAPPAVLVTSPRAEIRREPDRLLDGSLSIDERVRLEQEREADGETSALVVNIGAIATYPAIVPPRADYRGTLQTIAHEWVHHYLYFAPLGRNFYAGGKLVTLNETVANIAGEELGEMMYQRWPLEELPVVVGARQAASSGQQTISFDGRPAKAEQTDGDVARFLAAHRIVHGRLAARTQGDERPRPTGTQGGAKAPQVLASNETFKAMTGSVAPASAPGRQADFDFGAEMRALRLEVDMLLAAGEVEEAERVMEERRLEFVENGYYIRRINQAYFAFHGTYADTPASSDPIGPKMIELRERAGSIEAFVEMAREITSEADLDSLLAD